MNVNLKSLFKSLRKKYPEMLEFNPRELSGPELLRAVASQLLKLRYLCLLVAMIVLFLGAKVFLWVQYPWAQYLLYPVRIPLRNRI